MSKSSVGIDEIRAIAARQRAAKAARANAAMAGLTGRYRPVSEGEADTLIREAARATQGARWESAGSIKDGRVSVIVANTL